MITWRVYYQDGSTFSNEDGLPSDAPSLGAVAVRQTREEYGSLVVTGEHNSGQSFLVCIDGEWKSSDFIGLVHETTERLPLLRGVCVGCWLKGKDWQEMRQRIQNDSDFSHVACAWGEG